MYAFRKQVQLATRSGVFYFMVGSLMGCAQTFRTPIRATAGRPGAITAVNGHRQNVRVSLIVADGRPVYLGTVSALSTESLHLPAWAHDKTVQVLLAVESRSFRRMDEASRFRTDRPVGAATPYTVEAVNLNAGSHIELRIAQHLNQSRVVISN